MAGHQPRHHDGGQGASAAVFRVGAVLATAEAAKGMTVGTHGTTYGGNPLAMAVGNEAIDMILAAGLSGSCQQDRQLSAPAAGRADRGPSRRVRRRARPGPDAGAEDEDSDTGISSRWRAPMGLIVLPAGDNVVRLLPPLTLSEAEAREGIELLNKTAADDWRPQKAAAHNERAPRKPSPRHFLDLSDHDSATLRATHRRCARAQGGARAACPRACPMPTSRWTARCWR